MENDFSFFASANSSKSDNFERSFLVMLITAELILFLAANGWIGM